MPPFEKSTSEGEVEASFYRVCLLLIRMTPLMPPLEKYDSYYYRVCLLLRSIPPIEKYMPRITSMPPSESSDSYEASKSNSSYASY